jgi:hypothetical protein
MADEVVENIRANGLSWDERASWRFQIPNHVSPYPRLRLGSLDLSDILDRCGLSITTRRKRNECAYFRIEFGRLLRNR